MFFIYFPFSIIAATLVYFDAEKRQMPQWWPAMAFMAPITIPLYLVKTRQQRSIVPIAAFLSLAVLVIVGESFFFMKMRDSVQFQNYSPTVQEIVRITHRIEYIVKKFNHFTVQLEKVKGVGASTQSIEKALVFIRAMQSLMKDYRTTINNLDAAVNDYGNNLISENALWVIKLEEFYSEPIIVRYVKSLDNHLEAFESLLVYTAANFEEIRSKNKRVRQNYDGYYLNYVRALESHSLLDTGRMRFQYLFLKDNPELKPYMPAILNDKFFKIWHHN
ncbi:MAG: hypothetical protein HQK66_11180 [Desulfamplus sp.]|nr:hypothetical protein [Desulfamplus sp.]